MANLNEVRLIGNLTRDPELRSTSGGNYVCSFGIATNRKWKAQDGSMKEETTFVDVTAWGKTGENIHKYIKKGSPIYIGGRLKLDSWDDKTTGKKMTKLSVVAENVQFLGSGSGGRGQQQSGGAPSDAQVPMGDDSYEPSTQIDDVPF